MKNYEIVRAGDLRHRITFLKKEVSTDSDGYPVETWKAVFSVMANVRVIDSREYFQAAAFQAENKLRFTIRYRRGITAAMRLRYNCQDYEIIGQPADVDGRRRWLQITGEVVTDG